MTWIAGLIVIGELECDGCGRLMRSPDRYGYIIEEGKPPLHLCMDCSRVRGYLKWRQDEKESEIETFL